MNGTTLTTAPTIDPSQYPQTPDQLQHILQLLLSPDTQLQIQYATKLIQSWQKNDEINSVTGLLQQLTTETNSIQYKQISAVLLRRRILQQWNKLSNELQSSIKLCLLNRLEYESNRLVRHSVAALISTLAKHLVPKNQWNELIELLMSWCNSIDSYKRELSMMLFRALAENIGQSLKPHFKQLQSIFTSGLTDTQSDKVRVEAVYAIGVLVELIDNESALNSFKQIIQPLINVLHQHIHTGNEDLISAGFDVLDALTQSQVNILDQSIAQLIPLMIDVVINNELDINIRDKAASLTAAIIQSKPKTIIKLQYVDKLLHSTIQLLCTADDTCYEPGDDMTIQRIGVDILDSMTLYIPRKYIYHQCLTASSTLLQSESQHDRKAGLIILGIMAEGCSDSLRSVMSDIVPAICNSLNDSSIIVRISACLALTQFAEHLQPEILSYHTYIIPRVLSTLDQSNQNIQVCQKSITVLEVMLESMEDDIIQYIEPVMTRLIYILNNNNSIALSFKESSINAITAVAQAAAQQFIPYYNVTSQIILSYMQLSADEYLTQRCRATVCMGTMAYAVGYDMFSKQLNDTMKLVMNGMTLDYFELREASYVYFSSVLQILDPNECMSYISTIMPLIFATCFSDDGVLIHKNKRSALNEEQHDEDEDEINSDANSDDDDVDGTNVNISIRSGALDEKTSALQCMCTCIDIAADKYNIYLDKTIELIDELIEYPHPYIRQAIMHVSLSIVKLMNKLYPIQLIKGQSTTLPTQCKSILDKVVRHLYDRITNDEDKECVAVSCDVLGESIQLYGISLFNPQSIKLDKLHKQIILLLQQKSICHQQEYDIDDEQADIVADHDSILIDSVTDLIAYLAAAIGADYHKSFQPMYPLIMKYYDTTHQSTDRSMAIGCMAEVSAELGTNLSYYIKQLLPAAISGIQDNAVIVRRNAAYCYGNLAISGLHSVIDTYTDTIPKLQYMIEHKSINKVVHQADSDEIEDKSVLPIEINGAKDNAISALCKIITVCMNSNHEKTQQLIDYSTLVPFIINELPLQGDLQEAKYVYTTIIQLFNNKHELMTQYIPQIYSIWSQVLGDAEIDTTLQKSMQLFIQQLSHTLGTPQTEVIVNQYVPEQHKQRFIQFLTATQ